MTMCVRGWQRGASRRRVGHCSRCSVIDTVGSLWSGAVERACRLAPRALCVVVVAQRSSFVLRPLTWVCIVPARGSRVCGTWLFVMLSARAARATRPADGVEPVRVALAWVPRGRYRVLRTPALFVGGQRRRCGGRGAASKHLSRRWFCMPGMISRTGRLDGFGALLCGDAFLPTATCRSCCCVFALNLSGSRVCWGCRVCTLTRG